MQWPWVCERQSVSPVRPLTMKLLVGGFAHETNTFSSKPTEVSDFQLPGCKRPTVRTAGRLLRDDSAAAMLLRGAPQAAQC